MLSINYFISVVFLSSSTLDRKIPPSGALFAGQRTGQRGLMKQGQGCSPYRNQLGQNR